MPVFQLEFDTTKFSQGTTNATRSLDGLVRASAAAQKSVTAHFEAIKKSAISTTQVLVSQAQKSSAALASDFTVAQRNTKLARLQPTPIVSVVKHEYNAALASGALQTFDDTSHKIRGTASVLQATNMARDIEKKTVQLNDIEAGMSRQKQPFTTPGYAEQEAEARQASSGALSGWERGFHKYTEEATNVAKEIERLSYDMAKNMENSIAAVFESLVQKGKISFSSFKNMFSSLLNDLFRMAIVKPITVSIVGVVSGVLGLGGTAQADTGGGMGGAVSDIMMEGGKYALKESGIGSSIFDTIRGWFSPAINTGIGTATYAGGLSGGAFLGSSALGGSASSLGGGISGNMGSIAAESFGGSGGLMSGWSSGLTDGIVVGSDGLASFVPSAGFDFSSAFNPWSMGGGIVGGLGASMLTPELFKGANQQSVSTGTMVGSAVGGLAAAVLPVIAANLWNPIGWAGAIATAIGSLFGGVAGGGLGALFGGEVHKPGLWAGASLDLAKGYSGSEMEESSKDRKHPWQWYTHKQDDGYLVQARHRHGMSKEAAEQATKYLEEVSKQALGMSDTLMTGMSAINADLGAAYKSSLNNNRWTNVAQDWEDEEPDLEGLGKKLLENTRDKLFASLMGTDMSSLMKADDGAIADTADEIVGTVMDAISVLAIGSAFEGKQAEYVNKMGKKLAEGYGSTGIDISDYLSVDLNNLSTGMVESLAAAVTAINSMQAGVKQLQSPLSAVEQQAEAAKKQLDEYAKALEKSGLNQKWAAGIIEDYRKAMVDDYIKKLNESIHPASTLSTTMKNVNDSVTQTITAMKMMAATSEELAQIESQRAAILERAYENTTREYNQDYATRHATVTGGDKDSVSAIIARENELRSIEEKYGKGVDYTLTLAQKSAALNADKYQGKTDWTIDSVKKAIADAGLTVAGWFESFGRKEGFSGPDYTKVLVDKAASLNADKYQGKTDWTVESVKQAIAAGGMNVGSWYEKYGKAEGFAASTDFYAQTEALQKAEEAKRALDALQAQQNKYLQEQVNLSQKLVNSWQGVVDALNDTRAALHRENTDPARGFAAAQAEFDDLYAKALGGDSDAAAKMGQIGSELLAMGKKNSADQYIYQQLFNDIDKKLFDTGIYAEKEYDAAQVQLDLMNKQLGVQETTKDLTAEILKAQNALNAALAGLAAPKPEYKPDAPAMGSDAWKRSVLTAKAAALNAEKYEGKTNWTVSSVEKYMNNVGVTFEEWYKMYGKAEGFATGGVTPANTPFWVGERGPELMMTSQQYGVLSNADSLNMLARVSATSYADDYAAPYATGFTSSRMVTAPTDMAMLTRMPAAASDGGATAALHAAISELRDEVKTLRQDNKTLLGQVAKHTKDSADEAAHIRNTGMPTREYTPPPMHVIPFPE